MSSTLTNPSPPRTEPLSAVPPTRTVHTPNLRAAVYFRHADLPNRVAAAVLLLLSAPVIVVLMLAVRLTSPGPAIYRQRRSGLNGRVFWMYKIRSMRVDAELLSGAVWAAERDPRATLVGRIMRALHLDELPQLWNVLKGDMALVGPRPERPEFVYKLVRRIPGYLDRQMVRPGITGLAQINLPADTDYTDVRRKLILDREYIADGSLTLDLKIVACTFLRFAGSKGASIRSLLGMYRKPLLPGETEFHSYDEAFSNSSISYQNMPGLALPG